MQVNKKEGLGIKLLPGDTRDICDTELFLDLIQASTSEPKQDLTASKFNSPFHKHELFC